MRYFGEGKPNVLMQLECLEMFTALSVVSLLRGLLRKARDAHAHKNVNIKNMAEEYETENVTAASHYLFTNGYTELPVQPLC
jgi:hypothetical protein